MKMQNKYLLIIAIIILSSAYCSAQNVYNIISNEWSLVEVKGKVENEIKSGNDSTIITIDFENKLITYDMVGKKKKTCNVKRFDKEFGIIELRDDDYVEVGILGKESICYKGYEGLYLVFKKLTYPKE